MSTTSMRVGEASGSDERGSQIWWWLLAIAALLACGLMAAWLGGWFSGWFRAGPDPRVAEIRAMQEQARATFTANGGPKTVAEATAAVAAMNGIRERIDALPEPLRLQVERTGRGFMRDMTRSSVDAYFTAAPAARRAELDRQIDREEIWRRAFDAAGGGGGGRPDGGGAATGGGGAAGGGAAANGGTAGGNAAAGGPPRGGTQDDRNRWRKEMIIDRTTPEQRARYTEYRRAMEQRRAERGMPSGWSR